MIKIRIHGRGGQGARVAAKILGRAAFDEGFYTQDFALYGAERRGAPVTSFVRVSKQPILERDYIISPDYLIVLDDSLICTYRKIKEGLKPGTKIIVNTPEKPANMRKEFGRKAKIYLLNAAEIAEKIIGQPIFNTVMLGAFAQVCEEIKLKFMEKAIQEELGKYGKKTVKKNIQAVDEAARQVKEIK